MKTQLALTAEFHSAFDLPQRQHPVATPAEYELRFALMEEENREYLEACRQGDLVAVADALGDQLYVLCGTLLAHGMQDRIEAVFAEIHRSNMSKLDASGRPIRREDGKVIKSERYTPPDLKPLLP